MRFRWAMALLMLLAGRGVSQTITTLNLSTQGRNADFSNFPFTRPMSLGSALPSGCQVGQFFFNTAAPAGANVFGCNQPNTWFVVGGYTLLPAGPNSLGGVSIPSNSGLNVGSNGALSANVGTGAGTLAAGNDSRIVTALQPGSLIPAANVSGLARSATTDTTNASNVTSGVLSSALFPATIPSSTTGNAATATAFAATPTGCSANQYAQGVSARGTANCVQVAYSQVSGTPALYNQMLQVGGTAQTQRTNLNFAAGPNLMITPSDNGTNTTTLTLSASGGISSVNASGPISSTGGSNPTISCSTCSTANTPFINNALIIGQSPQGLTALSTTGNTTQVLHGNASGLPSWSAVNLAADVTGKLPSTSINGLAASATTDTTNAGNISSGTLNAARLPNPSASTLGGIESFTSPSHQWINSISTTGVPNSAQPAFGDITGSLAASQFPALTGDTTTAAGSTATTTSKMNGTSVPANVSADQTIVTTAAASGSWASLPTCLDSSGNHLNYNTTTHTFSCGNTGGAAGSAAFGSVSSGTNTQAAMLVGAGASLAPTGSGIITANNYSGTLPAASLPTPTLSTLGGIESYTAPSHQWVNAISVGGVPSSSQPAASDINGLAASATTDTTNAGNISSGTLNAARLPNPSASTLGGIESFTSPSHQWINSISTTGVPNSAQPAFGDIAGLLAASQFPVLTGDTTTAAGSTATTTAKVNGTSVPANVSADQTIVTTAAASGSWASLPTCLDSSGNHLNYNTTTHTFSCGNTGGAAGSAAFGSVSSGTNTQAAMLVGAGASLAPTGSGIITANNYSGTLPAASLPTPTLSTLGGIESYTAPSHQWVNAISVGGVPSSSQPAASDINGLAASATTDTTNAGNISSGTLNAARLPNPSASTLGGIESFTSPSHQWINSISTTGVPNSAQPAFGDITGLLAASQFPALTGDTTTAAGSTATTTSKMNGTSVPANVSADQTIVTTAAASGSWASLPTCLDSSGNHLNYNTTTHTFSCGNTGGAAGSAAFGSVSSGTNTQAAMLVGAGASLAPTGSGIITANNYSGTLPAASLPTPTLSTLGGIESYTAPSHQWVNAISVGGVPSSSQPAASDINGLAASATTDTTNAGNISSGTLNAARLPNPSASTLGGIESFTSPSHQWINSISTTGVPNSAQPAFGDIAGLLAASQFPALTGDTTTAAGSTATTTSKMNGTSVPANVSADQTIVTTAAASGSWASLPTCLDSSGNHLNYNTATHSFSCGTTSSGGGGGTPTISLGTTGKHLNNNGVSASWSAPALDCSQFSGADMSLKIQACLVALNTLNSQGGIADARNFQGSQIWSVNPFKAVSIPVGGTLLLPAVEMNTWGPVVAPNNWYIEGPAQDRSAAWSAPALKPTLRIFTPGPIRTRERLPRSLPTPRAAQR